MYHLRIELAARKMSELVPTEDNDFMEVFKEPLDMECVEFSVGNPRVEHITGVVHLYKQNSPVQRNQQPWRLANKAGVEISEADDVSQTLCCLAIPADMSVAHFCTFIGAYLGEVGSIQVLRREGAQPSVCMVLLTFASQEQADNFYADFNSLPFSSLEPDILCRLVYVRSVEVLSTQGRDPTVSLPAAAKTLTASGPAAGPAGSGSPTDATAKPSSTSDDTTAASAAAAAVAVAVAAPAAEAAATPTAGQQPTRSSTTTPSSSREQGQGQGQQGQQPYSSSTPGPSYAAAVGAAASDDNAGAAAGAAGAAGGGSSVGAGSPQQWLQPPAGTTELPTCPVCLERLDEHISGIVTTVCNHRFHGECIKHWGDTSCPVCRYCMLSSNANTSRCSTCGANTNLWICLICGHVGCGRYKQGHANDHWKSSAHCYALELETQRVWDYAGDGYVHRLIQSKTDGKLVEVPSPAPTCPHGSPSLHHHRRHHHHHNRQRSQGGEGRLDPLSRSRSGSSAAVAAAGGGACSSGSEAGVEVPCTVADCPVCADEAAQMKEVLVSSKLEAISLEYNHLLATQLDSQRQYFEGLLAQQDAKQQAAVSAAKAAAEQAQAASQAAAGSAKESERKRQQLERKLADLMSSLGKVTEEREFLRSLNETLLSNQKEFNSQLAAAQADLKEKEAQLQDLQEQVRDLMVYIEAQRTIQAEGGSELQDATLLPMPQSRGSSTRSSRRSSKK